MTLDEGTEAGFTGAQRSGLQQMTKLVNEHPLVHGIEPRLDLAEERQLRFFRQGSFVGGKRNLDFELLRQREVDREYGASFRPLLLPRTVGPRASRPRRGGQI